MDSRFWEFHSRNREAVKYGRNIMVFGARHMRFNFHFLSMMWLRTLALELGRTRFKYYPAISRIRDFGQIT